ncbi:MAG: adenosylcobinamide-GDP ribazoletransferase [Terriglobales bacterium]
MKIFRRLSMAISYVTCVPLARINAEESEKLLSGLAKYLPMVGLLLGAWLVLVAWTLTFLNANNLLAGAVLALFWLLLTNGLHFDGLMDTADGIFSHQSKERMLEIMQDPRVGNFGVLAGVSVLLLKFVSLASVPPHSLLFVLALCPAWSRWAETFAISAFPYLKPEGKGKIWHDSTKHPRDIFLSGLAPALLTAACCAFGYWQAAIVSVCTGLSGITAAFWLAHKLDGHTGDTYGAVVELAEAGGLLCAALILPMPGLVLPSP